MVVDTLNFAEALLIVQLADVPSHWGAVVCLNRILSSHCLGFLNDVFCCFLWVVPCFFCCAHDFCFLVTVCLCVYSM